jgi:hypothetical protein
MSSKRLYKLRRDVGIYTTGFILNHTQLTAISLAVCDAAYRRNYIGADPIFVLKWRVAEHHYELLPMKDGDSESLFFAISFFPYLKNAETTDTSDALFLVAFAPCQTSRRTHG